MRCKAPSTPQSPRPVTLPKFSRTDFKVCFLNWVVAESPANSGTITAWRKVLKDLIAYFREIQGSYEHRSKNLLKISNVINNTAAPSVFLQSGGVDDAVQVLRTYHKSAIAEANKSREIENDVILALVGLRNDLNQKIKEIKNLSGDFKNSVDKEIENTSRAVNSLQDGLGQADVDPAQITGKQDPYLLKLAVDRQVEKQIDEENYLHQVSHYENVSQVVADYC
jgi:hypothetical protein